MQLHQGFLLVGRETGQSQIRDWRGQGTPQPLQVESEKGFVAGVEPALRDQDKDSEF